MAEAGAQASGGTERTRDHWGRRVEWVENLLLYASGGAAIVMMLLISADALARYLVDQPITGAYEITEEYLLPVLIFLGLSYSYRAQAHVRVTLFLRFIPAGRVRETIAQAMELLGLVYAAALAFGGWKLAADGLRLSARTSSMLGFSLAPSYALVILGTGWLAIRILYGALRPASRAREPEWSE